MDGYQGDSGFVRSNKGDWNNVYENFEFALDVTIVVMCLITEWDLWLVAGIDSTSTGI